MENLYVRDIWLNCPYRLFSPETWWPFIRQLYRDRPYHNLDHIEHALRVLDWFGQRALTPQISWQDATAALVLHDIFPAVETSALFAQGLLGPGVADLVRATDHGTQEPQTLTAATVVDCDLAILGEAPSQYGTYVERVRLEYDVPDELWRPGRAAVLQQFLDREHIYHTRLARERFEQQARENIRRELEGLSSES